MRTVSPTKRFTKDFKREMRGQHRKHLSVVLEEAISLLRQDYLLPERFRDHALIGNWSDHRDCHLRPDLILIYRKPDPTTLQLVRLGSHSELEL